MKTEKQQQDVLAARTTALGASAHLVLIAGKACTFSNSTDTFTCNSHGFTVGMEATVGAGTLPSGFNSTTVYYVVNVTTNTFQLSATSGGSAITTSTTDGSGIYVCAVDPADPSTWNEATDVDIADRPALLFNNSGVTNDDANNKATVTWPRDDMDVTLATGAMIGRLGIAANDTGTITGNTNTSTNPARSISDTGFVALVSAGGTLHIPANSQTSSEQ